MNPPLPLLRHCLLLIMAVVLMAGSACAPQIQLTTPEPVRIDVNMNVKIEAQVEELKEEKASTVSPREGRRNRMAEVQNLKNDRVVGETMDGLLDLVRPPKDPEYLAYARRIVLQENADREAVFLEDAARFNQPPEVVRREFAQRAAERSFPGEWIQSPEGWSAK